MTRVITCCAYGMELYALSPLPYVTFHCLEKGNLKYRQTGMGKTFIKDLKYFFQYQFNIKYCTMTMSVHLNGLVKYLETHL